MTPEQKIKRDILLEALVTPDLDWDGTLDTDDGVLEAWEYLVGQDAQWDYVSDFRRSGIETGLPTHFSRHYECKEVAIQLSDGSWVGWTYWYGGGKHGEPEAIEWMKDAYELDVTEEEQTVTVRKFSKREPAVTSDG